VVVATFPINFPFTGELDAIISPFPKKFEPVEVPLFIAFTPSFSKAF
jgi:hypothetical protein